LDLTHANTIETKALSDIRKYGV